jgi:tRNA nucleotidyltransferase (CCA-adding enzyme)
MSRGYSPEARKKASLARSIKLLLGDAAYHSFVHTGNYDRSALESARSNRSDTHSWVKKLNKPAFAVGGHVRDSLLGKESKDVDYIVLASPDQIKKAVEDTGHRAEELIVRDRLVGVRAHGPDLPEGGVEIAPPRVEQSTGPGRKDFEIVPHPDVYSPDGAGVDTLTDDALRRDLTINALYEDVHTGEVHDPTGVGYEDLNAKLLRTTHPDSYRDDPLRILRTARFASQNSMDPTPETFAQMTEHADAINALTQKGVSGTVQQELDKLLMGQDPGRGLRLLRDTGALQQLFPELAPSIGFDQQSKYHDLPLDEHTISVVENAAALGAPLEVRLAALFHDSGKPEASWMGDDGHLHFYGTDTHPDHADVGADILRKALTRVNYPKPIIDRAEQIARHHMLSVSGTKKHAKVRNWLAEIEQKGKFPNIAADILLHRRADITAKGEGDPAHVDELDRFVDLVSQNANAARTVKDLAISGGDLIKAGIVKPGPEMGSILQQLLATVITQPDMNTPERLMALAAKLAP